MVADAPVSGGVMGAANGTLTFMLGCRDEDFNAIKDLLDPMAGNVFHCGGAGAGQTAKICNNMALGIQMTSIAEALALGEKLGMDPKVLSDVMKVSTARCWSVDTCNPCPGVMEGVPSSNNYAGGFGVSLIKKDLSLMLEAANEVEMRLALGERVQKLYKQLEEDGLGKKDFSVVYEHVKAQKIK